MSDKYTKIQFKRIKDTTKNLDSSEYTDVVPDYGEPVFSHTTNKDEMVIGDGIKTIPNLPRLNLVALNSLGTKFTLPTISEGDTNTYSIITTKNTDDIPDASATQRGLMGVGNQTFGGQKTFAANSTYFGAEGMYGQVYIKGTEALLELNKVWSPTQKWDVRIAPNLNYSAVEFVSRNAVSSKQESYFLPSLTSSDPSRGSYTIITTKNLTDIPDASGTTRGLVATEAQTFAGDKTFQNDVTINGDLIVGGETIVKHKYENHTHTLYWQGYGSQQASINFGTSSASLVWLSTPSIFGTENVCLVNAYEDSGGNVVLQWSHEDDTSKRGYLYLSDDYVQFAKTSSSSSNFTWGWFPLETPRIFTDNYNADKVGDFRVDTSGKKLYLWDGSAWKQIATWS